MSANFPSSNPFRRKPSSTVTSPPPASASTANFTSASYHQEQLPVRSPVAEPVEITRKITKKVRVQSPPPRSPSVPDSASTIGARSYTTDFEAPAQDLQDGEDPFGSTVSDIFEDEAADTIKKAPANPFSKTLATMEQSEKEGLGILNVTTPGRASMDVDAFKRLLMTGDAGLGTTTSSSPLPAHVAHHALGDGGSSTDTSSISRQSIFEAPQETRHESPRTSHEISEPEDDSRLLKLDTHSSMSGRKKPPPPSSRHGRLIRVELRDDPPSNTLKLTSPPSTPGSGPAPLQFNPSPILSTRSQTDLNKPLPPAPNRASHDSDSESIFDKEAAGKTPEPPSPSSSLRKKIPPAPPLARRRSQLVIDSKLSRVNSPRLSPKVEEDERSNSEGLYSGRPRSTSGSAPPPPPSRRPASIRTSSHHLSSPSTSTVSLPAPPPTRGSSRKSSSGRAPSMSSLETSTNSKRLSVIPPQPPPRARNSLDDQSPGNSRRPRDEQSRPGVESTRRDSYASSLSVVDPVGGAVGANDILADLSALQREIDTLRSQSQKGSIT